MNNHDSSSIPDEILIQAFAKLDRVALGLAIGTVCGIGVFLATIFLIIKGGETVGPNLALLGQYFIGYTVTVGGAFVGLLYGFLVGFIIGFLVAQVRNTSIGVYAYAVKTRQELNSLYDSLDQ